MKMEKTGENNIQHNRDLAQLVWILELGCTHGNTAGNKRLYDEIPAIFCLSDSTKPSVRPLG